MVTAIKKETLKIGDEVFVKALNCNGKIINQQVDPYGYLIFVVETDFGCTIHTYSNNLEAFPW